jgi:hypothetical protein
MAQWRYVVADLLTDRNITAVEFDGPSFDSRISSVSEFSGSIAITNADQARKAHQVKPGRTVIYCYRDGEIWAGPYLVWSRRPAGDERGRVTVQIGARSLESYWDVRELDEDFEFDGVDQFMIFRALLEQMQSRPESDLGITMTYELSEVERVRTEYEAGAGSYGKFMADLAAVENGFEYRVIAYHDDTGARVRRLVLGYPYIGQPQIEHLFRFPGNVLSWSNSDDASIGGTRFRARGDAPDGTDDGTGDEALLSDWVERTDLLSSGWPLIDRTDDYSSVTRVETLDAHARENAATFGGSKEILSVKVRLDQTGFSPRQLGDSVRINLETPYYPAERNGDGLLLNGFSQAWRVIGMKITPAGRGQGQDLAELVFENGEA